MPIDVVGHKRVNSCRQGNTKGNHVSVGSKSLGNTGLKFEMLN